MTAITWLARDILGLRRQYRVQQDRRCRWCRIAGWALACAPWLALWSLWWLVQQ